MADVRLRELERRWTSSGTPEAGMVYLRARLRSGDLSRDRLKLAAYLGDEPACLALGLDELRRPEDVGGWVRLLACWGHEPLLRALLVAARWNRGKWERVLPLDARPSAAIEAAELWCLCPCREHARAADLAARRAEMARVELHDALLGYERDALERLELQRVLAPVAEHAALAADIAAREGKVRLARIADFVAEAVLGCVHAKGKFLRSLELQMREALRRELIPWALRPAGARRPRAAPRAPRRPRHQVRELAASLPRPARYQVGTRSA